ncbi:MAG: hypothetical protein ACK5SX_16925 [Sandaracinobacter sp.]
MPRHIPFLPLVLNDLALAIALMALVLLAGAPRGWMPVAVAGGGVQLVICSSTGTSDLAVPGMPKAPADDATSTPCAFAGVGAPALEPPVATTIPMPSAVSFAWAGIAAPARLLTLRPRLSPPSRAPPTPIHA